MSGGEIADDLKLNFEDLMVYQKSMDLDDLAYSITKKFPKEEEYRITSQFPNS